MLLAGHSTQTHFAEIDSEYDIWSDAIRVYPKPPKRFSSYKIPKSVSNSLGEGEIASQGGAHIAACAMFGRALEAVCRDKLFTPEEKQAAKDGTRRKRLMLADGIRQLREKNIIDDRLYDWSQQLHAFRNVAAHPDDDVISITRPETRPLLTPPSVKSFGPQGWSRDLFIDALSPSGPARSMARRRWP
jgi:hypothetical protein